MDTESFAARLQKEIDPLQERLLNCSLNRALCAGTLPVPVLREYAKQAYLWKRYAQDLLSGPDRAWLPVLNGKVPTGFPFTDGIALPPGSRDQLFLAEFGRLAR